MNLTPEARAELRRRADGIRALVDELEKAEDFKTFVHGYLDSHGVPHGDPDNAHQKEGCRIGARLDLLFAQRDAAIKHCGRLLCFSCGTHWTPENDRETCHMAHRETWGHEWVPQRVLDLTQRLVEVNAELHAAEKREAALRELLAEKGGLTWCL